MATPQLVELESVGLELEMVALQLVELESVGLKLEMVAPQLVELESVGLELEMVAPKLELVIPVGQIRISHARVVQIGNGHEWVSQTGMHLTRISCAGICLTHAGVSELITVACG